MNRPFLFLSGEFRVTMPVVFERDLWSHTMSPSKLVYESGIFRRSHVFNESLKGVIFYADMDDKQLEKENLELILKHSLPCFPDPIALLKMQNRHEVLKQCIDWGYVLDNREFIEYESIPNDICYPCVVKTGNSHRGIDKYLVNSREEMPDAWEGMATVEPFFEGASCRLLVIGDQVFGIKYENDKSWIKNSAGCEVSEVPDSDIPPIRKHEAISLTKRWGLTIAGIDYVIDSSGQFQFLEINQFPGVDVYDREADCAKEFFRAAMNRVEKDSNGS